MGISSMVQRVSCFTLLICGVGMFACAQVDTTRRDSTGPLLRPVKAGIGTAITDSTTVLTPADSAARFQKLRLVWDKSTEWAGENLPHKVERDGKTQILVKLPSHEFYLPWLKAFEPNTGRPPYDPEVAWQRSVIFPGLGQAYNRSYWKMPIIYLGYAGVTGWIVYQNDRFQVYNTAFLQAVDDNPDNNPDLTALRVRDAEGLRTAREGYRKNRDYGFLFVAGWHLLQTVEAYVDAHLKGFDVGEDLSVSPALLPQGTPGFSVSLRW